MLRALLTLCVSVFLSGTVFAQRGIDNPRLVFDFPNRLTPLETCILEQVRTQSPVAFKIVRPGRFRDRHWGPHREEVLITAEAISTEGKRYPFKLVFIANDGSHWEHFSKDGLAGVEAGRLSIELNVVDYHTRHWAYTADLTDCIGL